MFYRLLFTTFLTTFFLCSQAFAFKLTPMSAEIKALGKEARTTFQVENDGDKAVPVQVTLVKRVVDEYGKEKYPPVGEDFLVFPTQVILSPGEKRSINVRYMAGGKSEHNEERAFRIIAEQLPLPLEKEQKQDEGAGINVLLRYIAALYVLPDKIVEQVEIQNSKIDKDSLVLTLKNTGTVHKILDDQGLEISASIQGKKLKRVLRDAKALKGFFGENILAGHERIFTISLVGVFDEVLKKDAKDLKVNFTAISKED